MYKSANTGDNFEHQVVVVAMKWQTMKRTEDKVENNGKPTKNIEEFDIRRYFSLKFVTM